MACKKTTLPAFCLFITVLIFIVLYFTGITPSAFTIAPMVRIITGNAKTGKCCKVCRTFIMHYLFR